MNRPPAPMSVERTFARRECDMAEHPTCPFAAFRPAAEDLAGSPRKCRDPGAPGSWSSGRPSEASRSRRPSVSDRRREGVLEIAPELPAELAGSASSRPERGMRASAGSRPAGTPHAETDPDFLGSCGLRDARTAVDFLALNEPAFRRTTIASSWTCSTRREVGRGPTSSPAGEVPAALASRRGALQARRRSPHVLGQSARTSHSTAFQSY